MVQYEGVIFPIVAHTNYSEHYTYITPSTEVLVAATIEEHGDDERCSDGLNKKHIHALRPYAGAP